VQVSHWGMAIILPVLIYLIGSEFIALINHIKTHPE
jgi:hypothetical protein